MLVKADLAKVVVRNEYFGLILWSKGLDTYLIPNSEIMPFVEKIVSDVSNRDDIVNSAPDHIKSELIKVGFLGDVTYINDPVEGKLSAPLDVYFDYTWACNLHCPFCYNSDVNRAVTMKKEDVYSLFKQMSELGVMRTHLAGGEPMIFKEGLKNYLDAAKQFGINSSVNSNGTLLDDELLDILFSNDLITLTFSLDGPTPEYQDSLRGEGNFEKVTSAIKLAANYKKRIGSDTRVQMKSIWMWDTPLENLELLTKLAIELGADVMQFHNPERCIYHDRKYYSMNVEDYYARAEFIKELQEKYKEEISIWNIWNPVVGCESIGLPNMTGCIGGQELLAINPDGSTNPCLMNTYELGNILTEWDSMKDFWRNSKVLSDFQTTVKDIPEKCTSCDLLSRCRGGSKTRVIVENRHYRSKIGISLSDLKGHDPLCPKDYAAKNNKTIEINNSCKQKTSLFTSVFVTHSL